jgi:hypothetical protein
MSRSGYICRALGGLGHSEILVLGGRVGPGLEVGGLIECLGEGWELEIFGGEGDRGF